MQFSLAISLLCLIAISHVFGAPPNRGTADEQISERVKREAEQRREIAQYVKYMDYLESVLTILQNTEQFHKSMKSMNQEDIRAGKIADVVDKLDKRTLELLTKAKVTELERLRAEIVNSIEKNQGTDQIKIPEYINFNDWTTFSKEDLRKLILKTVSDMDELEKRRKENFKEYEMRKKAEEDHYAAQLNEEEKRQYLQKMAEQRKRRNEHEPINHPGDRDQLKDLWENYNLRKDNFDARTLFALHDLNEDGYWSYDELSTIFQTELDKLYNASDPNYDQNERLEEMYRMREHVMKQMDKDSDRRISLDEFLADVETQQEQQDKGWEDISNNQIYTDEELERFKMEYAKQQGWNPISTPVPTSPSPYPHHQNSPDSANEHMQQTHEQPAFGHHSQQEPIDVNIVEGLYGI